MASCARVSYGEAAAVVAAARANESPETAGERLVSGANNFLCETAKGVWRLSPAMRSELNATLDKLGGDPQRLVVFHVRGSGSSSTTPSGSGGSDGGDSDAAGGVEEYSALPEGYDMDIKKGVERLVDLMQPTVGSAGAGESQAESGVDEAKESESESASEEKKTKATRLSKRGVKDVDEGKSVKKETTTSKKGKDKGGDDEISSSSSSHSHTAHPHQTSSTHLDAAAANAAVPAPHIAAAGKSEKSEPGAGAEATTTFTSSSPLTLMDRFKPSTYGWRHYVKGWLAMHRGGKVEAKTARRLLSSKKDKSNDKSTAKKKASAAKKKDAKAVTAPVEAEKVVAEEDMTLLQRARERFKSFELAMDGRASSSAAAKKEHKKQVDIDAQLAAAVARRKVRKNLGLADGGEEKEGLLSKHGGGKGVGGSAGAGGLGSLRGGGGGHVGNLGEDGAAEWQCVIVGDDPKLAAEVSAAIVAAGLPCAITDRVAGLRGSDGEAYTKETFELQSPEGRCDQTTAQVVDVELMSRAKHAVVTATSTSVRLAALLQQCREDRLDMEDWGGLGVHEFSVSPAQSFTAFRR